MNKRYFEAASRPRDGATVQTSDLVSRTKGKKSVSFYMSILTLAMIALIVSWDVTALSLALPVWILRISFLRRQKIMNLDLKSLEVNC
jgi:hypothetical protein